jgi:hypothetical protein
VTDARSVLRVEQTLRRVAQLRTLFSRLPHVSSPREVQWIADFEAFIAGDEPESSFEAMEAGLRDAHRRCDAVAILAAVERSAWIRSDPVLHPYAFWAERFARDSALAARAAEPPGE